MNKPQDNPAMREASPKTTELTLQQVNTARALALQSNRHALDVLEESIGLDADDFIAALGRLMHYPVFTILQLYDMTPDFALLPFPEAAKHECAALRDASGQLYVVCANPFDSHLQSRLDLQLGQAPLWGLTHRKDLAAFLSRFEESMRAMDGILPEHADGDSDSSGIEDISLRSISEDTSPVVKLVRSTLYDALKAGASDIHMESEPHGLTIKYRIDGVLNLVGSVNGVLQAEQAISRIKVMSELDIAERRVPQDGRFKLLVQGRAVDFRVSIMPSIHGEDAVLRILDKQSLTDQLSGLRLDTLGFDEATLVTLRRLSREPYGMLLVTGPTGSGKTTTLYAAISEINNGHDKIITIEDPVEYQLPGILQIPVNEKKGLTFARGLRSILRHDPDKIMVGEIRDPETAQIAIQSALTGHLVFTTVHANNVFDVLGRFLHMGVDVYSFVSALNGILAQRLIRLNCPHCSVPEMPDAQLLQESGLSAQEAAGFNFCAGRGCGQCRGTGYRGRKSIAEVLIMNDELRELIIGRQPIRVIKEAAVRQNTRFLRRAALDLVKNGETTLQEINRVTFVA